LLLFDPHAKEAHYQRKWTTFSTKPEIANNNGDKDHNERDGHDHCRDTASSQSDLQLSIPRSAA